MRYSRQLWFGLGLISQLVTAVTPEVYNNGDCTRPRRFRGLAHINALMRRSADTFDASRGVPLLASSAPNQMSKIVGLGKRSPAVPSGVSVSVRANVEVGGQSRLQPCDDGCEHPYPPPSEEPIVISGPGTLPRSDSYLTLDDTRTGLLLDDEPFRPVGIRLCNDKNIEGRPKGYPTDKTRVQEALAAAVAMVKVILTLTDNYDYYHGGKYTILRWLGEPTVDAGARFFADERPIQVYLRYAKWVLGRVNRYNNIAYGEDPTVSIIETGNELGAYMGKEGYPPLNWTDRVAQRIKQLAPLALVMDGTDGIYKASLIMAAGPISNLPAGRAAYVRPDTFSHPSVDGRSAKATAPGLLSPHVDIVTDHPYPRDINLFRTQAKLAKSANKVFLLGEMNWLPTGATNAKLSDYLEVLDNYPSGKNHRGIPLACADSRYYLMCYIVGVLVWSLFAHDSQCSDYVLHNDSYSIYYPDGPNTPEEKQNIWSLVQWFYRVTDRAVPAVLPVQACPQEVF
ncbi:BZ3500_MvSof-1268-A1-R1_Chr5-2g07968 [Microbotryum saponariae]|uniref:mannan endo-1,4-beta-mannosidase n=1 Tax=Microbotryum saponariae TaxID=289078 RepID=A0A2X0MEH5_9BASI|nr:BZ3500_MvSof-1268-A1-R1_Chr5-2g07968 [Microbotryum saponariae]SDA05837.1 BZ3501_MvSof-1269-A2-R1_Chr5-2g07790 [Microbotryum saponariae]